MKVTFDLEPSTLDLCQTEVRQSGLSLEQVVEKAILTALDRPTPIGHSDLFVDLPTSGRGGLLPGVVLEKSSCFDKGGTLPESDLDAEELAFFAEFGRLCHCIQNFEYVLANVLAMVFTSDPDQDIDTEVRRKIEGYYKLTAGRLKTELAKVVGNDEQLLLAVTDAVARRNHIIHHYCRERLGIADLPATSDLVEELRGERTGFEKVQALLMTAYRDWLLSRGLPAEEVARIVHA